MRLGTVKQFDEGSSYGFIEDDRNHKSYFVFYKAIKEEGYVFYDPDTQVQIIIWPDYDWRTENRCPSLSQYYSNLYETVSIGLHGTYIDCFADPNFNINCLDTISGQTHSTIDDDLTVHEILKNRIDHLIYGHDLLNISSWGTPELSPCD